MSYHTAKIRQFLQTKLSAEELEDLLFDRFTAVYDKVGSSQSKDQIIRELLKYCRFQNQFELLLDELHKLRPKQFDRADFVKVIQPPPAKATPASTPEPIKPEENQFRQEPHPQKVVKPEAKIELIETKQDLSSQDDQNLTDSFVHPITGKEMVKVPAGTFLYRGYKQEIYLDGFWIDKNPVTQVEYERFIDDNPKRRVPSANVFDWIFGGGRYRWNKTSRIFPRGMDNHPVVLVSWHDAVAYAKWAGLQLPTEQQWEKAARGTDGRKYPWGNEWQEKHANTEEAGLGGTSIVGQFSPQGDSLYGCADMCGNVWEWTASFWEEGSERRCVRGGSWKNDQDYTRAASRSGYGPNLSSDKIGFRLLSPLF